MSHNKNAQALESIQELSANLFYKKIREEFDIASASEKKLADDEIFTGNKNFVSEDELVSDENLTDNNNFTSDENLASDEISTNNINLTSEKNLAGDKILVSTEKFTSKENLADDKILSSDVNITGYTNFVSEENLAQNTSPAKEILPVKILADEENLASEENLAKNTLPAKNFLLAENMPQTASSSDKIWSAPDFIFASEENIANEENLPSNGIKERSSRLKLTTTTKEPETSEENITGNNKFASEGKIAGEGKLSVSKGNSRRNVPVENYDVPLIQLASSMGMASFGMLVILLRVLPRSGGVLRINAFARSLGMSANNVRLQLETLKNKELIVTNMGGEEGRWVSFTEKCLMATGNIFFTGEVNLTSGKNIADNKNSISEKNLAGKKIFTPNRFSYPLRIKEFYFACLKTGKVPENFLPAVIKAWVDVAEAEGSEYGMALLLEFLPNAKTNPSAYLSRMLENKVRPSEASMNLARQLLEVLGSMGKTIGEEILPKDWLQNAGKLGIRIKTGSVQELTLQQTGIMDRLEKLTGHLQMGNFG
jgi:hypothetical protein